MTANKAQKQAIRTRMSKTGERYTTARHYLLDLHTSAGENGDNAGSSPGLPDAQEERAAAGEGAAPPPRVAEPGASDAAVRRATGKDWDEWLALLDAWGASGRTHAEIARHLHETHGIDGWWAQSVTVGYERARGMRALHERPDGYFSVNVSKTLPVPVERLFTAFMDEDERAHWLDGVTLRARTSQPNRSARFDVLPGETRLAINFLGKEPEKASVQVQQERVPSAEEVERWRAVWKVQLARLADVLDEKVREP
jgi:hypothetical protein